MDNKLYIKLEIKHSERESRVESIAYRYGMVQVDHYTTTRPRVANRYFVLTDRMIFSGKYG